MPEAGDLQEVEEVLGRYLDPKATINDQIEFSMSIKKGRKPDGTEAFYVPSSANLADTVSPVELPSIEDARKFSREEVMRQLERIPGFERSKVEISTMTSFGPPMRRPRAIIDQWNAEKN